MKRILKITVLFLTIFATGLISCKKDAKEEQKADIQLAKITIWNPSTGAETIAVELSYDNAGIVSSAKGSNSDSYSLEYNTQGKLAKVNKTNPNGRTATYVLEYNTGGQVVKVSQTSASSGTNVGTGSATYEYNTAGKISKVTNTYTGGSSTIEYTWAGDNIAESKSTNSGGYLSISKYSYDDKKNPYALGGDIMTYIFYGAPASKNNVTEITTTNGATTSLQKRAYEYHESGYAMSMKLLDNSNEGQKYYYN